MCKFFNNILDNNSVVFIDTNVLMNKNMPKLYSLLDEYNKSNKENPLKITIFQSIYTELYRNSSCADDEEARKRAAAILYIIDEDIKNGRNFILTGGSDPAFFDAAILSHTITSMITNPVVVITNDRGLQKDLLSLNKLNSVKGKGVRCSFLTSEGKLHDVNLQESNKYFNTINKYIDFSL